MYTKMRVSFEVLTEWMCSTMYYTFVRSRTFQSALYDDSYSLSSKIALFLAATSGYITLEFLASFVQPLPRFFSQMKQFRFSTEYIWDQPESTITYAVNCQSWNEFCSSTLICCRNAWYGFLRLAFGWLFNEYKRDSFYNQYRNRCFIDSTMRLMIGQLTATLGWVRLLMVYHSGFIGRNSKAYHEKK